MRYRIFWTNVSFNRACEIVAACGHKLCSVTYDFASGENVFSDNRENIIAKYSEITGNILVPCN